MKNEVFKFFGVLLTVGQVLPANVQAARLPSNLTASYSIDAQQKVSEAARAYNEALKIYDKQGSAAFVKALPITLNQSDERFLAKQLGGLVKLPRLEVMGSQIQFFSGRKAVLSLHTLDVAQGVFRFNEGTLRYNHSKSLSQNLERWIKDADKITSYNGRATILEKITNTLFPSAHARSASSSKVKSKSGSSAGKGFLIAAGIIGAILLGKKFLPKILGWNKATPETQYHDALPSPMPTAAPMGDYNPTSAGDVHTDASIRQSTGELPTPSPPTNLAPVTPSPVAPDQFGAPTNDPPKSESEPETEAQTMVRQVAEQSKKAIDAATSYFGKKAPASVVALRGPIVMTALMTQKEGLVGFSIDTGKTDEKGNKLLVNLKRDEALEWFVKRHNKAPSYFDRFLKPPKHPMREPNEIEIREYNTTIVNMVDDVDNNIFAQLIIDRFTNPKLNYFNPAAPQ